MIVGAGERLECQPRLFGWGQPGWERASGFLAVGPKWQVCLEHLYMCKWRAEIGANLQDARVAAGAAEWANY